MKKFHLLFLQLILLITVFSCGSAAIISTPIENIDNIPLKERELTELERKHWMHLDLIKDTIPGMAVDRAYEELIKNKKGTTTIVAVIDSGIDITHEDLDDVIWVNKDEKPNNGIDDDNNGYVDDIHGWNFLGDTYNEQLEYVRLLASGKKDHPRYAEAQTEYDNERQKYTQLKPQYEQLLQQFNIANEGITAKLNMDVFTEEDLATIKDQDQTTQQYVGFVQYLFGVSDGFKSNLDIKKNLETAAKQINERLDYHLNLSLKGRKTGDDPDDFSQKTYGNNNVMPSRKDELHGTHVSGVIAAERNNGKGGNGIANNVKIMAIRVVPNGDEYDKDVALAIRYAVDNGAKIINMSFGKYYSPHPDWVQDAIKYAAEKDVLLVSGAGNDKTNIDKKTNYPTDNSLDGTKKIANNYISVGALDPDYGASMVADYSNYGKLNVDLFAPGTAIYTPSPDNEYDLIDGTSFASPAVAGIAALIRSQYPSLTASQVKQVLLESGLSSPQKVIVGGDQNRVMPFNQLSKSGKMANAFNALILASKMAKN